MKSKLVILTILILAASSLAIGVGKSGLKAKKIIAGRGGNLSQSKSAPPKKLAAFNYRKMKYAVYLITDAGADEENVEFIKTAQKLHDAEPETALILIDDDSGLKQYLAFMKEVERIGGGAPAKIKFPKKWAEEHVLGNVGAEEDANKQRRWYLMLGYARERIAELK